MYMFDFSNAGSKGSEFFTSPPLEGRRSPLYENYLTSRFGISLFIDFRKTNTQNMNNSEMWEDSLTFSLDGRLDPGGIFFWVEVSYWHHGGEFRLHFLPRTETCDLTVL